MGIIKIILCCDRLSSTMDGEVGGRYFSGFRSMKVGIIQILLCCDRHPQPWTDRLGVFD